MIGDCQILAEAIDARASRGATLLIGGLLLLRCP